MIRIPDSGLAAWALAMRDACMASSGERASSYRKLREVYRDGSTGTGPRENVVRPAVDRMAGVLFSPKAMSFSLQYGEPQDVAEASASAMASRILTRAFLAARAHLVFAHALRGALVLGTGVLKVRPDGDSFCVDQVAPERFGVLRESEAELDRQEALCEVSSPLVATLASALAGRPDYAALMERISAASQIGETAEARDASRVVIGVQNPIGASGDGAIAPGYAGRVPTAGTMAPTVNMVELWVQDAEYPGDYVTIQVVEPDIVLTDPRRHSNALVPADYARAPTELLREQPYRLVRPYPEVGSVWGWSLAQSILGNQAQVNLQRSLISSARKRLRHPVVGASGFSGISEEQYEAILSRGKLLVGDTPNAKAQELPGPQLGPLYEALQAEMDLLDKQVGFPQVLKGEGEGAVRSQAHAETLVRTASPRLISPALEVEAALEELGALAFRLMQFNDGTEYRGKTAGAFTLATIEPGWSMTVDSHSASPVFSENYEALAFDLARLGAIGPVDLIRMLRLPNEDTLAAHAAERGEAEAKLQQEAMAEGKKPPGPPKRK